MDAASLIGSLVLLVFGLILAAVVGLAVAYVAVAVAGLLHIPLPWLKGPAQAVAGPGQHIPPAMRRAVLERDGYQCRECGATEQLEMDHIIPKSRGGATTVNNLQVLCHPCNMRKGVS